MERILPEGRIYIPIPFQEIRVAVGEPFDVDALLEYHRIHGSPPEVVRAHVTDVIEMKVADLQHRHHFHP